MEEKQKKSYHKEKKKLKLYFYKKATEETEIKGKLTDFHQLLIQLPLAPYIC